MTQRRHNGLSLCATAAAWLLGADEWGCCWTQVTRSRVYTEGTRKARARLLSQRPGRENQPFKFIFIFLELQFAPFPPRRIRANSIHSMDLLEELSLPQPVSETHSDSHTALCVLCLRLCSGMQLDHYIIC